MKHAKDEFTLLEKIKEDIQDLLDGIYKARNVDEAD